jgi:UDP-N-acetylglucosamine--N-acetylmuramyl-(pentapeptide) pyrophosphoryl-undecaprenol N-acetylglucosamine transferase
VPLPTSAANHQAHNATALAEAGAAVVARQAGLTGDRLWAEVVRLADSDTALAQMHAAARGRARPDAASEIATDIERLLVTPGDAR